MLVAIAIVAIMLGLGVPSITGYIESAKLNSAAQGYLSGVQMARSTAIRQNLLTEFVLTDTPVQTANLANALAEAPNGQNWVVRAVDPAQPPTTFVLIESKSANESSANATQSVEIVGLGAPAAFTGIVPFNGFGGTADNNNYTFRLRNLRGGACAPAGPMRCPTILVPAGGLARICDEQVSITTDSRGCFP